MRFTAGLGMLFVLSSMAMLISAPAAILERLSGQQSPIKAVGCTGRLWRAGSCLVFLKAHEGWASPGRMNFSWRFDGSVGWQLALDIEGRTVAYLRPSFTGWSATNVEIRIPLLPLDVLPRHVYEVLQPIARLAVMAPSVSCDWRAADCIGKVQIRINDLILGKTTQTLGNYLVDLDLNTGGQVEGKLSTLSGALILQGQFSALRERQPRFAGSANLGTGVGEDVRRLLESIGQPAGTNHLTFPRTQ